MCEDGTVSGDQSELEPTFTDDAPDGGGTIEDRGQYRHGVDLTVTVNSEHNFYCGNACNLTSGGIFVATHIVHPVGTKFTLSIHLDDGEPGVVHGLGEVRWIRATSEEGDLPLGLGIRFVEIDDENIARIERFLAKREPLVVGPSEAPPVSS